MLSPFPNQLGPLGTRYRAVGPADIRDGLVLDYPCDEASGNTVYDASGAANHGTLLGGVARSTKFLTFDHTDDYVLPSAMPNASPIAGITFAVMMRFTLRGVIFTYALSSTNRYVLAIRDTVNTLVSSVYTAAGQVAISTVSTGLINTWASVIGVHPATGEPSLYINGQYRTNTGIVSNVAAPLGTFMLGAQTPSAAFYGGDLARPRLYNRALTADEVAVLHAYYLAWMG